MEGCTSTSVCRMMSRRALVARSIRSAAIVAFGGEILSTMTACAPQVALGAIEVAVEMAEILDVIAFARTTQELVEPLFTMLAEHVGDYVGDAVADDLFGGTAEQVSERLALGRIASPSPSSNAFHNEHASQIGSQLSRTLGKWAVKKAFSSGAGQGAHLVVGQFFRFDDASDPRDDRDLNALEMKLVTAAHREWNRVLVPDSARLEITDGSSGYKRLFTDGRYYFNAVATQDLQGSLSMRIETASTSASNNSANNSRYRPTTDDDARYPLRNAELGSTLTVPWQNTSGSASVLYIDGTRTLVRNGDRVEVTGTVIYDKRHKCKVLKVRGENGPVYFPLSPPTDASFFDCTPIE